MDKKPVITTLLYSLLIISAVIVISETALCDMAPASSDRVIAGHVTDESGMPVGDARVILSNATGTVGSPVLTDAAGEFRIEHAPSGTLQIVASKGDYADRRDLPSSGDQSVSLMLYGYAENGGEPAATLSPIVPATPTPEPEPSISPTTSPAPSATPVPVSTGDGYTISGTVYDSAGSPSGNASVSLMDMYREPVNISANPVHTIDGSGDNRGSFRFDHVPAGSYLVSAENGGHSAEISIDVEDDITDFSLYLDGEQNTDTGPVDTSEPTPEVPASEEWTPSPEATETPVQVTDAAGAYPTAQATANPVPVAVSTPEATPTPEPATSPSPESLVPEISAMNNVTKNTTVQSPVGDNAPAENDLLTSFLPSNVGLPLMATVCLVSQAYYLLFKLFNL